MEMRRRQAILLIGPDIIRIISRPPLIPEEGINNGDQLIAGALKTAAS